MSVIALSRVNDAEGVERERQARVECKSASEVRLGAGVGAQRVNRHANDIRFVAVCRRYGRRLAMTAEYSQRKEREHVKAQKARTHCRRHHPRYGDCNRRFA